MRMKSPGTLLVAALGALVAVGACTPDVIELSSREEPRLNVWVDVVQRVRAPDSVRIFITFSPGTDASGRPRRVDSGTVNVDGRSHMPTRVSPEGVRSYRIELDVHAGLSETVAVRPPRLAGVPDPPDEVVIPLVQRAGADVVSADTGEAVGLRTVRGTGLRDFDEDGHWGWRLVFTSEDSEVPVASLQGQGPPPDTVTVAVAWFGDLSTPRVRAEMSGNGRVRTQEWRGAYPSLLSTGWRLRWEIRLREAVP